MEASFTYDKRGNLTKEQNLSTSKAYTYDAAGKLTFAQNEKGEKSTYAGSTTQASSDSSKKILSEAA